MEPSCLDGAQFHSWQKKENLFLLQLLRLSSANLQSHLPVPGDSWMVEWVMSCLGNSKAILLVHVYEGVSLNLEPAFYCFVVGVHILDLTASLG